MCIRDRFGNDQRAWIITAVIFAVIALILLLICFFNIEERVVVEAAEKEKIPVGKDVYKRQGLNDPFFTQYFRWLFNCLHGNFGKSYSLNKPVVELLAVRVLPTLKLTLMSLILMMIMAVPLGVASALHKDGIADYICRAITFVGCAMPNFWVCLLYTSRCV